MYVYHPIFSKIKKIIFNNISEIKYVIVNFTIPSKKNSNNRYLKNKGNGFYYDLAVYPISLETYLFDYRKKLKKIDASTLIKTKIDLRGSLLLKDKNFLRIYNWGEGLKYKNNIEIVLKNKSIYCEMFFSKKLNNKKNYIEIYTKNKIKKLFIKYENHFDNMFNVIKNNFQNTNFRKKNYKMIEDHLNNVIRFR